VRRNKGAYSPRPFRPGCESAARAFKRISAITAPASDSSHHRGPTAAHDVGAIGVVFGDIGTSPLYALKEAFSP
jgi:hypothetical protein